MKHTNTKKTEPTNKPATQTKRSGSKLSPPPSGISFVDNPIQKKNNTGLPDQLKSGIESLSGIDISDVKVHYNSSQPAQLNAHAYAQGNQIHVAPGQEKHLPHEAWHVVQQKQGRVKPTKQFKGKVNINDDVGLEKEADVMGDKTKNVQLTKPLGKVERVEMQNPRVIQQAKRNINAERRRREDQTVDTIQFGSRPGWPDNPIMSRLVTHAVFRVNAGRIMGYGKNGTGQIIPDGPIPPGTNYTWINPTLNLRTQYRIQFLRAVSVAANGFYYTGFGGNCYTPVVHALTTVRAAITRDNPEDPSIQAITNVMGQLSGANYGMGTRITNTMLAVGAGLVGIAAAATTIVMRKENGLAINDNNVQHSTGEVPFQLVQHIESSPKIEVVQRVISLESQTEEIIRMKLGEEIRKSNGIIKKGTQYGVEINEAEGLLARVEWKQAQKDRAITLIRSLRRYVEADVKPTVAVHMKK